ncbi:hypothetical protein [Actinophytocola sp.]|uniref:hypothetical protein n=1 Tax=Actinophytocola sp. TaxID=1872138 RepID=UPI003D6BDE7A
MPPTRRRLVTRPSRRARRSLASARILDQMVADHLALVARLPEESRHRAAEFLAELVMLSQAYRHHAAGWISRRELERRGNGHVSRIAVIRRRSSLSSAQFTERD